MASVEETIRLYCVLMEEIKARTNTIFEYSTSLRNTQQLDEYSRNIFIFEGLYLSLRKICELLAVSALLVHNCDDLDEPVGKLDEYAADKLINLVSKINPDGFPKPVSVGSIDPKNEIVYLRDENYVFDGADLKSLYRRCGEILHTGSLKDILRTKQRELNQDFVLEWCRRLINGLGAHAIGFPDKRRFLFITMETPDVPMVTCRLLTRE